MDCNVVAELRPLIGSCQFFIRMDKGKGVSKVVATSNKIFIKGRRNDDIVVINIGNINIASDSLSGLQVLDCSVQFRIRIEPKKIFGCFKKEMLFKDKNSTVFVYQNDCYKPDIKANEEVTIWCRQCSTAFNRQPFKFERILPLPTSFDTSDFFCHNNLLNNDIDFKPEDCFYGLFFIQINYHSLGNSSDKVLTCCHCQAWLGVKENNSTIFWNSSVKFKKFNEDKSNISLYNFISVIKHVISKDLDAVRKVILYAKLTNNEMHYLLLWVIENNLSLLTNKNTNSVEVLLEEQKVFKVLYLHETEESNIVKKWENDMNTSRIQISKQMITEGLSHLENMSQNIPEDFREANQMAVSYIMV